MKWPVLIALFTLIDLVIAYVVVRLVVRGGWTPLPRQFPARAPAADAVARSGQSFRVGLLNLGWAVHVAVDDDCLHLTPARFIAWLGLEPASIPWEAISVRQRKPRWKRTAVAAGGLTIEGPSWCLDLAEPADDHAGDAGPGADP